MDSRNTDMWTAAGHQNAELIASMKRWAVFTLAEALDVSPGDIDTSVTFDILGVDSLEATVLASGFEEEFGIVIDPYWLLEYPALDLFFERLPELLNLRAGAA